MAAARFGGIRYRARHDPAGGRCLALFGSAGERRRWKRGRAQPIEPALLADAGVTLADAASDGDTWDIVE